MKLIENINLKETKNYRNMIEKIKDDFGSTKIMRSDDIYDPEVVFYLNNMRSDESGYAHFMQEHPDGTSDYVCFNTHELDHGARWIAKNKNVEALGIVLPATCEVNGFLKEKEKGNIKIIEGGKKFVTSYKFGYLDKKKTKEVKNLINRR
ncbi:hypothetical protein ES708_35230 [subsurface metagenome]